MSNLGFVEPGKRFIAVIAERISPERRLVMLLTAVQFTLVLDFMLIMPMGPALMKSLKLSLGDFGLAVTTYTWCSALAGFTAPFWLTRVHRTRALLALYGLFVLGTIGCAMAGSGSALLAFRATTGGAAGLVWSLVLATVVDLFPPDRRGRALGAIMTSYALATILGVPIGLLLANRLGCQVPYLVLATIAAVILVLLGRCLQFMDARSRCAESEPAPTELRELLKPSAVLGWMLTFAIVFSGFLLIPYLGLHLELGYMLRREDVALVYSCGGICALVTSRLIGWATDRLGPSRVLAGLMCLTLLTHAVMTHVQSNSKLVAIVVFAAFMTSTSGRMIPALDLLTELVPPRLRTSFLAINTGMTDVSSGMAAMVAAGLLGSSTSRFPESFATLGRCSIVVTLVGLTILWVMASGKASLQSPEVVK